MSASKSSSNHDYLQNLAAQTSGPNTPLDTLAVSIDEAENLLLENKKKNVVEPKPTAYAWLVLFVVFLVRAVH